MSASKLDLVLRLTNEEEKQAALTFQAVQNDYLSAEKDLKQALNYRVEYAKMSEGLRPGTFVLIQIKSSPLISHTNRYFDRPSACYFEVKTCSR